MTQILQLGHWAEQWHPAERGVSTAASRGSLAGCLCTTRLPSPIRMAARLTAKLVGSGYERPNAESELPLDINYAKLGEWLVSSLLGSDRPTSNAPLPRDRCLLPRPFLASHILSIGVRCLLSICLKHTHACCLLPALPPPAAASPAPGPCVNLLPLLVLGSASPPQVDRKQVPADYNRKLQAIQAKAAEALRELPPGFLGQFEGEPPWSLQC